MEAHVVYQFRAYTNKAGYARIDEVLAMQRDLYNAAILERKYAREWIEKVGDPGKAIITHNSQSKALTALRAESSGCKNQNWRLAMGTLGRVELHSRPSYGASTPGRSQGIPGLRGPIDSALLRLGASCPARLLYAPGAD